MAYSPESPAESGAPTLRAAIGRVIHALEQQLPPGDVAALRHLDPADPAAPAFYKVAASVLDRVIPEDDLDAERRWAAILGTLAVTVGLHRFGRPLGAALASAGFNELRLTRLLRASGDQLFPILRGAAQFLASKAEPFDPVDLALLALSEGRSDEEKVRRVIARTYFAALTQKA